MYKHSTIKMVNTIFTEYKTLCAFDAYNRSFVVYTDGTENENGKIRTFLSEYEEKSGMFRPVVDKKVIAKANKSLKSVANQSKTG